MKFFLEPTYNENFTGVTFEEKAENVFVLISGIECYSVHGHFELKDVGYFDTCIEITEEKYKEITKNHYTPADYFDDMKLPEIYPDTFENIAQNIAHDILTFEGTEEEMYDYLSENFQYTWLESNCESHDDEWILNFDCEVLFDSIRTEKAAHDLYHILDNRVWSIVNEAKEKQQ